MKHYPILTMLIVFAACSPLPRAEVTGMEPNTGPNDMAIDVVISGNGFVWSVEPAFNAPPANLTFAAKLGGHDLRALTRVDAQQLRATVPMNPLRNIDHPQQTIMLWLL